MFNHPESTKTTSVERKKDDIEFVHRFINQGLQPVQSCFGFGRYTENLSYLKGAVEDFSRVSVCIDRNEDAKKVIKELVQRAKQQTNESTDKKYVVRGAYHPYIQEMNKE